MHDGILDHIQLEVPCPASSETYRVSAATVLESQRLMDEGCPGTSRCECPPRFYARLLPRAELAELADAFALLESTWVPAGSGR